MTPGRDGHSALVIFDKEVQLLQARWGERTRPLPPESAWAWARARYSAVLAADGATLDALLRHVGLLRAREGTPLAGRMTALLDL